MRNHRLILKSLLGASLLLLPPSTALADGQHATTRAPCQTASAALVKSNANNQRIAKQMMHNTRYTPIIRNFTPKPSSTVGFDGYQTITVRSPQGTTPVVGYFKLSGAQRCSVVVTSAAISLKQNAYVVKLKFPGEQGNPGRLAVGLVSR